MMKIFICEMILMLGQKLAVMTNKYTWHDQQRYWIILQLYTNNKWYYRTEWSPIQFLIILGINEAQAVSIMNMSIIRIGLYKVLLSIN